MISPKPSLKDAVKKHKEKQAQQPPVRSPETGAEPPKATPAAKAPPKPKGPAQTPPKPKKRMRPYLERIKNRPHFRFPDGTSIQAVLTNRDGVYLYAGNLDVPAHDGIPHKVYRGSCEGIHRLIIALGAQWWDDVHAGEPLPIAAEKAVAP